MFQKTVTISAPNGIHTRPAALLVKAAQAFPCDILVESKGRRASAKSLFRLQTLALSKGTDVTVSARGEQAEQAVDALSELISTIE